jgi:sortase B
MIDNSKGNNKIRKNDIYVELDDEEVPKKKKKKINFKKLILKILLVIFICTFLFSFINLARWTIYNRRASSLSEELKEENFSEDIDIRNIENKYNENKTFKNPVDFESLKQRNEDIVAWIRIDGTDIDYPIVQADDNEYYLHRDIDKKYNTCGWIFMDYKNTESFIDKNTVIYGHNIKSGMMFSDLQKILNNKYGNDITIEIYTQTEKLEYRVYSCYMEEPEDYAIKSNLVEEDDVEKYINEMLERSYIPYNIVPDKTDKLITLSTCDSSGKNRILVHGVYVSGQNYEE